MPEGPSIAIAAEELAPFIGQRILSVAGNSKVDIQRLKGQRLSDIFSYGKYLNFQLDGFALRIHFMMFGSYRINEVREGRAPRLSLATKRGDLHFYSCSVRLLEEADLRAQYDFRTDVMSPQWNKRHVLKLCRASKDETADDLLMNQEIFTGVGNIIKNEVLFRRRLHPSSPLESLPPRALNALAEEARVFSLLFYELKKRYVLKKNLEIYRRPACPRCGGKVTHTKTGHRDRMSHFCPACQRR